MNACGEKLGIAEVVFLNCKLTAVFHGVVASNSMKKRFKIYGPDVVVLRRVTLPVEIHAVPMIRGEPSFRDFVGFFPINFIIPSNDLLLCRIKDEQICNKKIG